MTTTQSHAQMEGLATLLVLNDEVRKVTNLREFGFFTTNETHRLIPYHMAFLWTKSETFGVKILTQSGAAELDPHAITNQWLQDKIAFIAASANANKIHMVDLTQLDTETSSTLGPVDWKNVFQPHLLWCPLFDKNNELNGGLIFLRESPFTEPEMKMISWLISSYQYTWVSFIKHPSFHLFKYLKKKPIIFLLFLICLLPLRLSVLGNATVVPKDPVYIDAPIEGVINSFSVNPGEHVKAGQLLFTLDKTELESNVEVSKKELLLTQAKLRTAINQGIDNEQISAEIPILKAQLAIDNAHIAYTNELLAKTNVTSPITGIVVFNGREDWIGQPVHTGERILVVTNPKQVELKIMLPIANIIDLNVGNEGSFFVYGHLEAVTVTIKRLGYNAKLLPNKILAYEITADFSDSDQLPQLGAQGTVRLYGNRVPLIYYILRKPLQSLRQSFGL